MTTNKTDAQIEFEKHERKLETINKRAGFYRENPHRFVEGFLNFHLKTFQKILIYAMMKSDFFVFIASRGLGKSTIIAIFSVVRCILYPETKICVASKTLKQAIGVLKVITENLCVSHGRGSDLLNNEIEEKHMSAQDAYIKFKNGSFIYAVVANENSRFKRSNINIYDEYVQMDVHIMETVLDKFLTSPRTPQFMNKEKYKDYPIEENKKFYLSSAWYKGHWSYDLSKSYISMMLNERKKYFICSLPYQLGIKEGIIMKQTVQEELSSPNYNPITFGMEWECKWYGDNGDEFFSYDDIAKRRLLKTAYPPIENVISGKDKVMPPPPKDRRILSVDVALMASKKKKNNDASSIHINDAKLASNNVFIANFPYTKNYEGMTTDELGITVMRHYYKYFCTDIVIDTNGIGLGVYDFIIKDQVDPDTGEVYKGLSCINNDEMADRCKIKGAKKVIWSIKASEKFNSQICTDLRTGFQLGRINLLVDELDAEDILTRDNGNYSKLSDIAKLKYKMPYYDTTLTINELVNLKYDIKGNSVKVYEKTGMRKDRYSSIAYNYYVMKQIEQRTDNRDSTTNKVFLYVRKPKIKDY